MAERTIDTYFQKASPVSASHLLESPVSASPVGASPVPRFVRLKNQATTDHKASPGALSIIKEGTT